MYPVKNSASNTRFATFRLTPRAAIKFILVCLMTISVPYALYVRVDSKNTKAALPNSASGRANSYLNVKEGQTLRADYRGEQSVTQAMRSGDAKARALTSTDIDGDITSYRWDVTSDGTYDITGPELITVRELAALAGVEYDDVDDAAMRARFLAAGMERAEDLVSFGRAIREGWLAVRSDDLQTLTGRRGRTMAELLGEALR